LAKVLLINPNKWGRGITPIWIPSHAAVLNSKGHQVSLFDCTFYKDWSVNEIVYNTENKQYKSSDYDNYIEWKDGVYQDLAEKISNYKPDIIFISAISSHIHGEGEYVNIQYGHDLLEKINLPIDTMTVAGGLQPTASPETMFDKFPKIQYFIRGESEFVLGDIVDNFRDESKLESLNGLVYKNDAGQVIINKPQEIISNMDEIPPYDYSLFEEQIFYRPYNGKVVKAVDYELSRGCIYTCSYCVETVIQKYYGFTEKKKNGMLAKANYYLRCKSAKRVYEEIKYLHQNFGVILFRCQDTNFLTIKNDVLQELATLIENDNNLENICLYIETRPEGINHASINLLKRLKVDGVGMGVELAADDFRESNLNRYSTKENIINAFDLLKKAGIRRTSYNIIGLPGQDEKMILDTIIFNQGLHPDNMTVAFYSPYIGTEQQQKAKEENYFDDYEYHVDGQLRSVTKSTLVSVETLNFYKKNFIKLVTEGIEQLEKLKEQG